MDKTEAVRKVKQYAELLKSVVPLKRVILFGSYAAELSREDSDIDVAVIVDEINGDYLECQIRLYNLRREVDDRIEPLLIVEGGSYQPMAEALRSGTVIFDAAG